MEMVEVMEISYERALSYWKKENDGKSGQSDYILERMERIGSYVVRGGIKLL